MSSRQSNDSTSGSGVNYAASHSAAIVQKNIKYSQQVSDNVLQKNGAFNGHVVEVWADGSVWDTVSNVFLFPGRDYNPSDVQKR